MRLAENTNTSISSISILVDETITCFHDATNDTSQANILAEKALQLVNEAANVSLHSDWSVSCSAESGCQYIYVLKICSVAI